MNYPIEGMNGMICKNIDVSETLGIQRRYLDVRCGCGGMSVESCVRETKMVKPLRKKEAKREIMKRE